MTPMRLDHEEQAVMDHIVAAHDGLRRLGLQTNGNELASAIHVVQGFVIQHMLQRVAPQDWSQWFT